MAPVKYFLQYISTSWCWWTSRSWCLRQSCWADRGLSDSNKPSQQTNKHLNKPRSRMFLAFALLAAVSGQFDCLTALNQQENCYYIALGRWKAFRLHGPVLVRCIQSASLLPNECWVKRVQGICYSVSVSFTLCASIVRPLLTFDGYNQRCCIAFILSELLVRTCQRVPGGKASPVFLYISTHITQDVEPTQIYVFFLFLWGKHLIARYTVFLPLQAD